jgi:MraZ protein
VAELSFYGASALTLDGKGRLAVPTRHRDVLVATGDARLTLTKHPDGALILFPRSAWEAFSASVVRLPMGASDWKRIFLGHAMELEIDGSSRILIAPELRTFAGLSRDVLLLGMGRHFEIWDAQRYGEREAAALKSPMPDAIRDFVV